MISELFSGGRWAPVMSVASKIAMRVVPPILDAVDDGADVPGITARLARHLSVKGIGPASPQTVELFVVAFASLAIDLKGQDITRIHSHGD